MRPPEVLNAVAQLAQDRRVQVVMPKGKTYHLPFGPKIETPPPPSEIAVLAETISAQLQSTSQETRVALRLAEQTGESLASVAASVSRAVAEGNASVRGDIRSLEATMLLPVEPVYKDGKLIGAQRVKEVD